MSGLLDSPLLSYSSIFSVLVSFFFSQIFKTMIGSMHFTCIYAWKLKGRVLKSLKSNQNESEYIAYSNY